MKNEMTKFLLSLAGCLSLATTGYAVEKVVATVNGTPILKQPSQTGLKMPTLRLTERQHWMMLSMICYGVKAIKDAKISVSQQQIQQICIKLMKTA